MSRLLSGYIDRSGEFVIDPTLRTAAEFCSGLACAVPYRSRNLGFIDRGGAWVVAPQASFFGGWSDGVATFNVDGRREDGRIVGGAWGWVGDGRLLCPPRFERVGRFKRELIAVAVGGQYGYADATGTIRVAPRFEWAGDFSADGVAPAAEGGKEGYIRADGSWLLPPRHDAAYPVAEGRALVRDGDAFAYLDLQGNRVSETYDDAHPFEGGMAMVRRGDAVGFVDRQGALIGGQWFAQADRGVAGLAPVRRGDEWFFLAVDGRLHGPFRDALPATEGLGRFVVEGEGIGFMRSDGTIAIPPRYESAREFTDGLAAVARDGKWTFVDPEGRELHAPHWELVGDFGDGLAPVRFGGKWGVLERGGQLIVQPRLASIERFSDGLAAARAVDLPRVVPASPRQWTTMPREGLRHPGFTGADAQDELRLTLCFAETPNDDARLALQQLVDCWCGLVEANHHGPVIAGGRPWVADYAVSVRLHHADDPVAWVQLLLDELAPLRLPVQEATFGRFRADYARMPTMVPYTPATPHPDDPQGEDYFSSFEEYAEIALDPSETAPRSENLSELLGGRWLRPHEDLVCDERVLSLYRDDVRICYGITQPPNLPADERTARVNAVVDAHLARLFDRAKIWVFPGNQDWRTPVALTRDGSPGIERIEILGRRAYAFGIDATDLLQDVGPDVFRYREPELMEALAGAVAELGLAPVILWQRFGEPLDVVSMPGVAHPMKPTVYVINLLDEEG